MLKFHCACGKKIGAPDEYEGRRVKCPKCGMAVVARREEPPAEEHAAALAAMTSQPVEVTRVAAPPPPPQAQALPTMASAAYVTPPAPSAVYVQHPQAAYSATIVNVPQQKGASGFGIAALVIGIIAVLFCWVPFVGMLAIPLGLIALLLATVGVIVSLAGGKSGVGLPVAGGVLALLAIGIPILMTGAMAGAVGSAAAKAAADAEARSAARRGVPQQSQPPGPPADLPTFSAEYLVGSYTQNEVAADEAFKGKWLKVTGQVDRIGKDVLNTPYVTVKAGNDPIRQVQCMFDQSQQGRLASLRPGQEVVISGKCSGLMMNVLVRECDLVE